MTSHPVLGALSVIPEYLFKRKTTSELVRRSQMTTLLAVSVLASGAVGLVLLLAATEQIRLSERALGPLFVVFVLLIVMGVAGFLLLALPTSSP